MKRLLALGLGLGVLALLVPVGSKAAAPEKDKAATMEALQALQDFIGDWKGAGGPDKARPAPGDPIWSEAISWGWRFKGDDAWLIMKVKDGKFLKEGQVRYLPDRKKYQFTATFADGKTGVFVGDIKNDVLVVERTDPDSKQVQILRMNSAAEGARFIYAYWTRAEGTTVVNKVYAVASTREGVSLGPTAKKNVCVVSGGLGTRAISYKGETYYVCCSGCADAFNENPEKYIAEFKAKKGK